MIFLYHCFYIMWTAFIYQLMQFTLPIFSNIVIILVKNLDFILFYR
nr:MAG TPA: hypothetical protein [Caudoviricetes sp.]